MNTTNDPELLRLNHEIEKLREDNARISRRLGDMENMAATYERHGREWQEMCLGMAKDRGPQDKTLAFDQALTLLSEVNERIIAVSGEIQSGHLQDILLDIRKQLAGFLSKHDHK